MNLWIDIVTVHARRVAISILVTPYRHSTIDYEGHGRNIDYLLKANYLDGGRRRVIGIAGASLIHHIRIADQLKLMAFTGECVKDRGVLLSGIAPNPIGDAEEMIIKQCQLSRPPDVFLLMPLTGVSDPGGIYEVFMAMAERVGRKHGARFLYYLRQSDQSETAVRLINESPYVIGVKIGTSVEDVRPIRAGLKKRAGMGMWGLGDRCTEPAEAGTRGHTSGISIIFGRASDEINNAQRKKDYATAREIEQELAPLEEIRFRDNRRYNYSAIVEAMRLSGFDDIVGGDGGPFNPRVPPTIAQEIEKAITPILGYH